MGATKSLTQSIRRKTPNPFHGLRGTQPPLVSCLICRLHQKPVLWPHHNVYFPLGTTASRASSTGKGLRRFWNGLGLQHFRGSTYLTYSESGSGYACIECVIFLFNYSEDLSGSTSTQTGKKTKKPKTSLTVVKIHARGSEARSHSQINKHQLRKERDQPQRAKSQQRLLHAARILFTGPSAGPHHRTLKFQNETIRTHGVHTDC